MIFKELGDLQKYLQVNGIVDMNFIFNERFFQENFLNIYSLTILGSWFHINCGATYSSISSFPRIQNPS